MSLYSLWMQNTAPDVQDVEEALQGNLCRCTGYAPIVRAALAAAKFGGQAADILVAHREQMIGQLRQLDTGQRVEISSDKGQFFIPADVDDLAALYESMPGARLVAGSTDVGLWVTKFMRDIEPVIYVGGLTQLQSVLEGENAITIGAGVSYTQMLPLVDKHFPQVSGFWRRIGGQQVRNMGTIGGNIANGSPIGDTPPMLIALGAAVTLRKGDKRRFLPLEKFFIDYGKQDREPGEFVEMISIPKPDPDAIFAVHKISKRRDEDISALCGAFYFKIDRGLVQEVRIAFGGMAATPKRAKATERALLHNPPTEENFELAVAAMTEDYAPISDMRASKEYRMLAAQNLVRRVFLELEGEQVSLSRGVA